MVPYDVTCSDVLVSLYGVVLVVPDDVAWCSDVMVSLYDVVVVGSYDVPWCSDVLVSLYCTVLVMPFIMSHGVLMCWCHYVILSR